MATINRTSLLVYFGFLCLAGSASGCRYSPSFEFATVAEQARRAAAVIRGTVQEIISGHKGYAVTLILSVSDYLKGCGQKTVIVSDFRSSALCGSGIPRLNEEIIVFACETNSLSPFFKYQLQKWRVNNYQFFAGVWFIEYIDVPSGGLEQHIRDELKLDNEPNDCSSLGSCGKKPISGKSLSKPKDRS